MNQQLNEIKEALRKETHGAEWTNFDGKDQSKIVYEYDHLTEDTCAIIAECETVEMAQFIADCPQWLASLVSEVERLEKDKELTLTHIKEMDFTASGQPAMVFYEMLRELFEQNGGKNFLTITLENRDKSGRYSVTIRNLNGEFSEAEKLNVLEKQVEEMQKTLEWYADKDRYISKPTDADFTEWDAPEANEDEGERARQILQSLKGEDKHE